MTAPAQGSVQAEGAYGTAAGDAAADRYPVAQAAADIDAAGRRAWGGLLVFWLRGVLAMRDGRPDGPS